MVGGFFRKMRKIFFWPFKLRRLWQAVCSKIESLQYMFNPLNNGFILTKIKKHRVPCVSVVAMPHLPKQTNGLIKNFGVRFCNF